MIDLESVIESTGVDIDSEDFEFIQSIINRTKEADSSKINSVTAHFRQSGDMSISIEETYSKGNSIFRADIDIYIDQAGVPSIEYCDVTKH